MVLGGLKLKVTYINARSCFAYVSVKYRSKDVQNQCIQVLHKDRKLFLWMVFVRTVPEGQIGMDPVNCRLLSLKEGTDVFISSYGDMKVLDELYIETDSPDDQEILEDNVETMQLRVLDQMKVVVANQRAIIWIAPSMPIIFTPKKTGLLVNHSKIIVTIDALESFHRNLPDTLAKLHNESDCQFSNIGLVNSSRFRQYMNVPKRLVFRALPIQVDVKRNSIHPYIVYLHEDFLDDKYKESTVILATMKHIPFLVKEKEVEGGEVANTKIDGLCVEIVLVENAVFRSLCHEVYDKNIPTVLIPRALNVIINIENGSKIIFEIIGDKVEQPDHIEIVTYSDKVQSEIDVFEKFKDCVVENTHSGKKLLINDGMVKQNLQISKGFLQFKLKPDTLKYTMLDSESFRHCTVAAKCLRDTDLVLPKLKLSNLEYDCKNYCKTMKSVQSLVDNVLSHIYFEIHREANFKGVSEIKSNILVTGLHGKGKSALCHIVQSRLTLWSHILHCRALKGRKDIPEVLGKAITMCQERSPAVLICDDVDALVPPSLEGAMPQELSYYQRLTVVIKKMLQNCRGVCVLMTSVSMQSLHPVLREFNGKPLFTSLFDIKELDQSEREELFKHLLNEEIQKTFQVEEDDVIKMARETTGCTVREIVDYLNKKLFKGIKKKKAHPEVPKPRLVEDIVKDEEKAKAFDIWGPVGGLDEVKQELTECLFWPLMYPALFPSQSCGVLLYGPPGTGKSHIGSCLAKLTNMRLLVVKGPELLSKYIGQSEKAVRDIFDKADMLRPCILFFDEFDSLAPTRGHDSTGVTDRVVNQLLARLDGAEGGARGPVLAATARPDLLDPALLRAGRLQRHVRTALPAQRGRYEVLETLAKDVAIHESVQLEALAARTEGYSPADLKALLITAQLGRLERLLVNNEDKNMESVVVYQEDIDNALAETKPSLSAEQRLFYDMIYKKFRGERLTPEELQLSLQMKKERVTLA